MVGRRTDAAAWDRMSSCSESESDRRVVGDADERVMRIGIAGAGAVGRSVAQELLAYGHKVLLIEQNAGHYEPQTVPDADWLWPTRSCPRSKSRECRRVMSSSQRLAMVVNLTAALLAKTEFGVARVVARVNDMRNEWLFTDAWGVDVAVCTPRTMVASIEGAIDIGHLVQLMELRQGQQFGEIDAAR